MCATFVAGIVVTDGGCSVVADAQGAAKAVEAMKAHLVDVEVCKMGAAVLYAPWTSPAGRSSFTPYTLRLRSVPCSGGRQVAPPPP